MKHASVMYAPVLLQGAVIVWHNVHGTFFNIQRWEHVHAAEDLSGVPRGLIVHREIVLRLVHCMPYGCAGHAGALPDRQPWHRVMCRRAGPSPTLTSRT